MARPRFAVSFGEKLDLDLVVGEGPPPATEGLVVPQDVTLIMGELDPFEDVTETPQEILAESRGFPPRRLGSLVVGPSRQGAPVLLQAIVYDFERCQPSREEHVFEALLASRRRSCGGSPPGPCAPWAPRTAGSRLPASSGP